MSMRYVLSIVLTLLVAVSLSTSVMSLRIIPPSQAELTSVIAWVNQMARLTHKSTSNIYRILHTLAYGDDSQAVSRTRNGVTFHAPILGPEAMQQMRTSIGLPDNQQLPRDKARHLNQQLFEDRAALRSALGTIVVPKPQSNEPGALREHAAFLSDHLTLFDAAYAQPAHYLPWTSALSQQANQLFHYLRYLSPRDVLMRPFWILLAGLLGLLFIISLIRGHRFKVQYAARQFEDIKEFAKQTTALPGETELERLLGSSGQSAPISGETGHINEDLYLANAYVEMGDYAAATELLNHFASRGLTAEQLLRVQELKERIARKKQ